MAVETGYSKTITSGSVFLYDTGDTYNSYKGEPTTNYWNGNQFSIYNDGATNIRNSTDVAPPVPGYEVVKVTANNIGSYGQCILWNATYPNNNVATITNSIYAYLTVGDYVQVGQHWWPWYYGTQKAIPKNQWVRISETYTINEGNSYGNAALTYSTNGIAYFAMPQFEYVSHVTPFIGANQTRSNTQGLLDISGRGSTITLANMSYDANAQPFFDGTDDYINTSTTLGANCTLELVIQSSNYNVKIPISLDGDNYSSGPNIFFYSNVISWNTGDSADNPFSNSSYLNSNYHHIVVSNTSGVSAILYIDGVQIGTANSLNATTTGANKLWIGRFHGDNNYTIAGNIPIAKVYNRALTASEVRSNYNHYKTRFNLP